jgi:hypothetical protein
VWRRGPSWLYSDDRHHEGPKRNAPVSVNPSLQKQSPLPSVSGFLFLCERYRDTQDFAPLRNPCVENTNMGVLMGHSAHKMLSSVGMADLDQ